MLKFRIIFGYFLLLSSVILYAQQPYPQGYFKSPLGIELELAGNFGEFRPNHFHTGLDFKTQQKENLPVYAAAEGFVSRIAISHSGYGNCLYLQHPNGYTTVYAHLNTFDARIAAYVKTQQEQAEKWNIDVTLDTPLLYYQQGAQIALSGNTGGSVAPHLHFEIRNTATERVVNAMHFNFPIKDQVAPIIYQVGVYDAQRSIYTQAPFTYAATKNKEGAYTIANGISVPYHMVRLGLIAQDFMNQSVNTLGVYKTSLWVDDKLLLTTQIDELDFATNRCINAYADYQYRSQTNAWMQLLFKSQNNELNFYQTLVDNGVVALEPGTERSVKIAVSDFYGNTSELSFKIRSATTQHLATATDTLWRAGESNTYYSKYVKFITKANAFYDDVPMKIVPLLSENALGYGVRLHTSSVPLAQPQELYVKLLYPLAFELRSKLVFRHEVKAQFLPGANPQSGIKAVFKEGYAFALIKTLGMYQVGIDTLAPKISEVSKVQIDGKAAIKVQVQEESTSIKYFKAYLDGKFVVFERKGAVFTHQLATSLPKGAVLTIRASDENDNVREVVYDL